MQIVFISKNGNYTVDRANPQLLEVINILYAIGALNINETKVHYSGE